MYIIGYVMRSSTKDKRTRNTAKSVQAPDSTEVTSELNQVLESQSTTNKNPQSITQNTQHDDGDIAMGSPVEESKRPTNCSLFLKRRQALIRKQQAVKQA